MTMATALSHLRSGSTGPEPGLDDGSPITRNLTLSTLRRVRAGQLWQRQHWQRPDRRRPGHRRPGETAPAGHLPASDHKLDHGQRPLLDPVPLQLLTRQADRHRRSVRVTAGPGACLARRSPWPYRNAEGTDHVRYPRAPRGMRVRLAGAEELLWFDQVLLTETAPVTVPPHVGYGQKDPVSLSVSSRV